VRGTLFLIVGPSGAGKDTLIEASRERLPEGYVLPRRTITRPAQPGGEDHVPESPVAFDAQERAGAFALSWRAHGVAYGIPATIEADLARGNHIVANVSRTVVEDAKARFQPARVILVTASPAILAARLRARGRETGSDIDERLSRAPPITADTIIVNDGALEPAIDAFVTALKG
jgi:ribose 1,5-bisphosphokinase